MRWLIPVWMVAACASQPPAGDDDALPFDGGNGGGGGDDITPGPDAAPPVEPCDPHAFVFEPVDVWGGGTSTGQAHTPLRIAHDGAIDLDYALRPGEGAPRRAAHRAPGGGWTFADSDALVFGNVVHANRGDHELVCFIERTSLLLEGRQELICGDEVVKDGASPFMITGAITPDGVEHVFFTDTYPSAKVHAWRAPGEPWQREPVFEHLIGFMPLVVDDEGCIHTAYSIPAGGPTEIRYRKQCGADPFTDELVERGFHRKWLSHAALALDPSGAPTILYPRIPSASDAHSGELRLARRDATGGWAVVTIASGANVGLQSQSLAFTPNGDLHAAYHVQDGTWQYHVEHLRRTPAGVETRTPLGASMYNASTSVAIAPDGEVLVVFDRDARRLDLARVCH
jgi:hypothetical protein